jgi:hypothetical protein
MKNDVDVLKDTGPGQIHLAGAPFLCRRTYQLNRAPQIVFLKPMANRHRSRG